MPIGKNALKRVTNNGYSAVTITAPDMENSVIEATPEKPVKEKPAKAEKKTATEKTAKKAPSKKESPKKDESISADTAPNDKSEYVNIGREMPYHLL